MVAVRGPVEEAGERAEQLGLGGIRLHDDHLRATGADVIRVLLAGGLGEDRGRRTMKASAVYSQVEGSAQHDRDTGPVMGVADKMVTRREPRLDDVESIQCEGPEVRASHGHGNAWGSGYHRVSGGGGQASLRRRRFGRERPAQLEARPIQRRRRWYKTTHRQRPNLLQRSLSAEQEASCTRYRGGRPRCCSR